MLHGVDRPQRWEDSLMWDYYYSQAMDKWVVTCEDVDAAYAVSLSLAQEIVHAMSVMAGPGTEEK
ncbi:hypothetical protein IVIADoCa7_27 [Xanthomonas phage vB_Xar_IVIA-DoCa7]|uniref:Uncharacterized protein n=1 Tax=Xanthomonas phage vB_Xar_IVIA-DoCa7 TaxID=2975534 RepID=A0A9X9JN86_9CAUD|nr:hypothetical protein IVIADoCa7_27 [Xanthomonas phage vB_Xar_IVIA-DoCa7]